MHHRPSCICALPERYRLLDVLGEGGEGVACLVEDLASGGRLLTLKAVRGAGGGKVSRERLREIFLALSRLAHPGLARVRDFGRLPGATGLFFTADFVPGRPLLDWAASLEKEPSDALVFTIGAQALSVLSYLERKGIHHGDLKPQNIIIEDRAASGSAAAAASDDPGEPTAPGTPPRSSPRLFLIDFGAARLRDAAAENTSLATAAYLPPRWSLERESAISQDLYALGLTLLQLHAGRLPFPLGDESAQRAWHLTGQPASPRRWRPDVSPALDLLLQRLTHPDPAERFASAAAALEFIRQRVALPDLEDFSTGACPGFYGRREQVDAIASLPERRGPGIALLAGPPGIGKTRLLDAARLRARSAGRDAIAFASPADGAALAELEGRASRRPSERPAPAELRAAQILAAVKPGTLILVDDAEKAPFPPLLREIVRQAAELRAARKPLACVLATADPAAVIERASLRAR
ncbi:MAG: serine/threonine-protein kinase PknK, partial [Planctomycetes bacterium]|nr:serine/threonine-protein kinase PknK [Planctomycetota bacterium]